MTAVTFIPANPATHRQQLLELNLEYLQWVLPAFGSLVGVTPRDMLGMDIPEYTVSVIDKVCGDPPPRGIFYIVECDGALAGMGGMRWIRDGVAEVKRIYVRPTHRGQRLGEAILQRILADATSFGYSSLVLDTAPFMESAQRMYAQYGFVDRGPYPEVEAPKELHSILRFMEKTL